MHDIKIFPGVLSGEFCNQAIDRFRSNADVQADPQPDYSKRRYLNISKSSKWRSIALQAAGATQQIAEDYFALPKGMEAAMVHEWLDDGYILAHYQKGDDLALHVDGQSSEEGCNGLRLATVLFFLNTCEGGELEFPRQKTTIKPFAGSAVMFPVGFTHPHRVKTALSERFILQTWLTDPHFVVNDSERGPS
jgi:predicted 2-oxoglutarate/Fe(II)-dependent dioxygenase YbiX